ncbi:unnamed protein product [Prorocentrum cordatum]|uniref:Mitochondrial import inner membrane translocase subunit TIM50 n=1 Tax=Prorocentrum cordatum TaxID=2364126 RepID=A0ABN9TFY8_9DINO|nr:unnamed protein product [Polarella glacialis]
MAACAEPRAGRGISTSGPPRVSTLPVQKSTVEPMLLVLDLDETLVRVSCEGVHCHKRKLDRVDFSVDVQLDVSHRCHVSVRPGVDDFLAWIQERRRQGVMDTPWIFTTSTARYTKAILRHLDPGGRVFGLNVLTQQACALPRLPGFFLKERRGGAAREAWRLQPRAE